MPVKSCAISLVLFFLTATSAARAEWDWYAGNLVRYGARNTPAVIRERVQQGIDAGLDWLVLSGYARQGFFTGLREIVQEQDLNTPRITPILGAGWAGGEENLFFFGVDPRAPVPRDSLGQVVDWVESQSGISVFSSAARFPEPQAGTAFLGLHNGVWDPACEPGAEWDNRLTSGRRIFLLAGGTDPHGQTTCVWAENNQPGGILAGLRRGAAYVTQAGGIRMDFRVNGQAIGATVPVLRDAYIRLRAVARHPISRVQLVADGEVVWVARPDSAMWEERFFLPLTGRRYVRAIVESEQGGYRAMGNPVFLVSEIDGPEGEIPLEAPEHLSPSPIFPEIDGALEAVSRLPAESQARILAEFLRDARMRHSTVRVLEFRQDLISDLQLWNLLGHPDPEVRLGTAYALVVRTPAELADLLRRLLEDPEPRVREYAARMMFQYADTPADTLSLERLNDPSPDVRAYLIRALNPQLYEPRLTHLLIAEAGSNHPAVAAAAADKLVELGNRSYRVIQALLNAARDGNPDALEPVGWIGDRRAIPDLERLFRQQESGPLKRASFLALETLGAPYLDRRETVCAWMPVPPVVNGLLEPDEWTGATQLQDFLADSLAEPAPHNITAWAAHDSTYLYLALACELPDTGASAAVRTRDEPGLLQDCRIEWSLSPDGGAPYVFSVNPLGVVLDRHGENPAWNPEWQVSTGRKPGLLTVECAIPLSAFSFTHSGLPGPVRFNLAQVLRRPDSRRWTWSVTYGSPHNPARYGEMAFAGAP